MSVIHLDFASNYFECDAAFGVEYTFRFFLCYKSDKNGGYYYIYDTECKKEVVALDFDFDVTCVSNRCIALNDELIVFIKYSLEEEKYYNYSYDLLEGEYFLYKEEYSNKRSDGSLPLKINIWGEEIVVPKQITQTNEKS